MKLGTPECFKPMRPVLKVASTDGQEQHFAACFFLAEIRQSGIVSMQQSAEMFKAVDVVHSFQEYKQRPL
jgi:hypothetical protein